MTDAEIVQAVRSGTHALVPMPRDGRKFFIGNYADADIANDQLVLILDLFADRYEDDEMLGVMMGEMTSEAADARAAWAAADKADDLPF